MSVSEWRVSEPDASQDNSVLFHKGHRNSNSLRKQKRKKTKKAQRGSNAAQIHGHYQTKTVSHAPSPLTSHPLAQSTDITTPHPIRSPQAPYHAINPSSWPWRLLAPMIQTHPNHQHPLSSKLQQPNPQRPQPNPGPRTPNIPTTYPSITTQHNIASHKFLTQEQTTNPQ